MSASLAETDGIDIKASRGASPAADAMRAAFGRPAGLVAGIWLVVVLLAGLLAAQLAPYDPYLQNLAANFQGPSAAHWLGTDDLGRDMLSRLIYGGAPLLLLALLSVVVAVILGVAGGLQAGFRAGPVDSIMSFVANVILAIPGFVILVALTVITGQNQIPVMAVLGILLSASIFRLVRATTQATREMPFVDAARVSGLTRGRVLVRHVLPNIAGPLLVQAFVSYSIALIIAASLAFLGLGQSPLDPTWGQMIYGATQNLAGDPWMMVPVGVALILTILAVNFIGSSLRDGLPHAQRQPLLTARPTRRTARRALERDWQGSQAVLTPARRRRDAIATGDGALPITDEAVPFIEIRDATIAFPRAGGMVPVVDHLNLRVERGAALALVGESGCGKTMTALSLLGLVPPPGALVAGSIRIGHSTLTRLSDREMEGVRGKRVALIPQEPMAALDPSFTIGSQLGEALRLHRGLSRKAATAETHALLSKMGIAAPEAVAKSYPHEISGGMAQRVLIALSLTGNPEVLVADEPTTALDVTIQAEILDILRGLQREFGMTLIIATHDLGVVADIATDVAVMYAGQIVETGRVEQVMANPVHPYTKALMAAIPDSLERGQRLAALPGTVPLPHEWPAFCRFASRCRFVLPKCLEKPIELYQVSDDRTARCVRADEFMREAADAEHAA